MLSVRRCTYNIVASEPGIQGLDGLGEFLQREDLADLPVYVVTNHGWVVADYIVHKLLPPGRGHPIVRTRENTEHLFGMEPSAPHREIVCSCVTQAAQCVAP